MSVPSPEVMGRRQHEKDWLAPRTTYPTLNTYIAYHHHHSIGTPINPRVLPLNNCIGSPDITLHLQSCAHPRFRRPRASPAPVYSKQVRVPWPVNM